MTDDTDTVLDELERLRAAVDRVLAAIDDEGRHPEFHRTVHRRHSREWPTLWGAIGRLRAVRSDHG